MLEFFKDGGWSMFVILAFGCVVLVTAGYFAVRPDARHEGFIKWMSFALICSVLVGVASDLGTVFHFTATMGNDAESQRIAEGGDRVSVILQGCAESLSPPIMGFGFLTLAAMLTAVGRRRLDAKRDA
jgi:hypothetical protein